MYHQRIGLLDSVATSSGTSVLLGVVALIGCVLAGTGTVAICLWLLIAVAMLPVIRHYNLTLHGSPLACALFLLLQAACATVAYRDFLSWCLAASALAGSTFLFESFQNPKATRQLFSAMLIAGVGMVFSWAYVILAVAFLIGSIQMRSFSLRSLVAMLLGLLTGPLLLYGFQIVRFGTLPMLPSGFMGMSPGSHLMVSVAFSLACALAFGGICALTAYGYQARIRSYNALIYTMTICALICAVADLDNSDLYITWINLCAAYHIGHFAVSRSRGWIGVIIAVVAMVALFVWNVWM